MSKEKVLRDIKPFNISLVPDEQSLYPGLYAVTEVYGNTIRQAFTFVKYHADLLEAKRMTHKEYDLFFPVFQQYAESIRIQILRELRAPEGLVGYLIRVNIECTEKQFEDMKHAMRGIEIAEFAKIPFDLRGES